MERTVSEILAHNAKTVVSSIRGLSADDLAAVRAAEAEGKNRKTIITAIDKAINIKAAVEADEKTGGKAARGEIPAWQKPDYDGPMTCEMAHFRNNTLRMKTLHHRTGKKPKQLGD